MHKVPNFAGPIFGGIASSLTGLYYNWRGRTNTATRGPNTSNPSSRPGNSMRYRLGYLNRSGGSIVKFKKRSRVGRYIKKKLAYRNRTYKMLKYEKKFFDTYLLSTSKTPPGFAVLNYPGPGASDKQRIGNKIQVISVQIRALIGQLDTPLTTTGSQLLRCYLILDRQPNMTVGSLALTTILDNSLSGIPLGLCYPNNLWTGRFKILKTQVFEMDKINGEVYSLDWYQKLNITTTFGGTSGAANDISSNALIFAYVPTTDTSIDAVTVQWSSRIRFYDC